jgi:putative ABC transport system permease protein
MLKNYFKTAWRNLVKSKLFSFVNIAGLALGAAGSILIGLYLVNELSYDEFHKNADRLVRATTEYTVNGERNEVGNTGSMAGPRLKAAFPQIESFVRILNFEPYAVGYGDRNFVEKKFLFADSAFFTMFSFPLLEGNPETVLDGPGKVVISRSMERKYFGAEQALGKTLLVGGTRNYIVSGVATDAPENSQIKFDFVASYSSLPNANNPTWGQEVYATYFLLRQSVDRTSLEKYIGTFMRTLPELADLGSDYLIYHLEPITRVHLYSKLSGLEPSGNIQYIYILAAIALLILIIAAVNYTNLATAQAAGRIPEIGIRKVLGSMRVQLFWQFIGESLLLNLFAMAIAFILVALLLPPFDQLVERKIQIGMILQPSGIAMLLILYCCVSFIAGIYPALVLSGLKLIKILKTGFSFSGGAGPFRKSLIIFQFFASVFLIISTVVIFEQMSFIKNKDLGYDKSQVVVLPVDGLMRPDFTTLKESIARLPNVLSVSCGAEEPTNIRWDDEITLSSDPNAKPLLTYATPADPDFVRTLGLHIIAGTDFSRADWLTMNRPGNPNPQTSFMVNETLAKSLGWKAQEAPGKIIYRSFRKGVVKAVVKDFNFAPLHQPIAPLVIFLDSQYYHIYQAFVKISGSNIRSTLRSLEENWKTRVPHRPFEYHFLDDNFNTVYHTEEQTVKIFTVFSGLAILLACLGLFALAAYTTVQRAKEIGIRKVLGAGELGIVLLISRDFLKLVAISMLLAFPVAWYFLNSWLNNFAYRIQISWIVFLISGCASATIAFASIFIQAYKAAVANPVRSLKTE